MTLFTGINTSLFEIQLYQQIFNTQNDFHNKSFKTDPNLFSHFDKKFSRNDLPTIKYLINFKKNSYGPDVLRIRLENVFLTQVR